MSSQEKCFYSTQGFFVCSSNNNQNLPNKYESCIQYEKEYKNKSFMIQSDNCKNPVGSRGLNCQNK